MTIVDDRPARRRAISGEGAEHNLDAILSKSFHLSAIDSAAIPFAESQTYPQGFCRLYQRFWRSSITPRKPQKSAHFPLVAQ